MENRKHLYRIDGKMYKYIMSNDAPYSTIHTYQEIENGDKFFIEEQTEEEIQDEKNAWNIA